MSSPASRPCWKPANPSRHNAKGLPATVADFTGWAAELQALTRMLDRAGAGTAGTVVISAIGGTAGVGKTALALRWAHQVATRFPDGHLYVNLRGFDPSDNPTAPTEAIRGFLDALGVPPDRIAASPEAQAGLYRSLLADKPMLIVLDNARDEQQVRPLLPASWRRQGCLAAGAGYREDIQHPDIGQVRTKLASTTNHATQDPFA
jgi:hypothetical protein